MSTSPQIKAVEPQQPSRARQARTELLDRISEFMLKHDLNVTGANLAAVGTALSGSNAALAEAFVSREISGEPIDQRWLDTAVRLDPEIGSRMNELEKLMDRIEGSLVRFSQTVKTAQDETSEQRGALGEEIEAMAGDESLIGVGMDKVIDFSKAVLNRVEQIESAMERSQAESDALRQSLEEARIEADVDHLTQLPNRRAFERQLTNLAEQAAKNKVTLSIAFCDVDHFKSVNDTHGHDAGDRVLISIANLLKSHASKDCFVARQGGEEFVMLLYGYDQEAAWRKLDGIRRTQAAKQLINRETGKSFGKITFSAGVAEVENVEDAREALGRADQALYQAKESGRNQIVAV